METSGFKSLKSLKSVFFTALCSNTWSLDLHNSLRRGLETRCSSPHPRLEHWDQDRGLVSLALSYSTSSSPGQWQREALQPSSQIASCVSRFDGEGFSATSMPLSNVLSPWFHPVCGSLYLSFHLFSQSLESYPVISSFLVVFSLLQEQTLR